MAKEDIKEVSTFFEVYGTRESAIQKCIAATNLLREMTTEKDNGYKPLSQEGKEIRELCASMGPLGAAIAQVMSIHLGENLAVQQKNKKFPYIPIACIIPTVNGPEGHNYSQGVPIFMFLSDDSNVENKYPKSIRCLKSDGTTIGNSIIPTSGTVSIASDEIIAKVIGQIFDAIEK